MYQKYTDWYVVDTTYQIVPNVDWKCFCECTKYKHFVTERKCYKCYIGDNKQRLLKEHLFWGLPSGSPTSESPTWWAFLRWDFLSPSVIRKSHLNYYVLYALFLLSWIVLSPQGIVNSVLGGRDGGYGK